jgi:ribonuclease-3
MPKTKLCQALGYAFRNPRLLDEALTHRSAAGPSNERLEFLGDSILNFVIAEELFRVYPIASEGELSRLRASLVNGETLAKLARSLALGDYLSLGSGELKNGGFSRASILADALEAVFGAVYLDSDFETCRQLILGLYREYLVKLPAVAELKDPKTRLQEYLQARQRALPVYSVLEVTGKAHAQSFTVECSAETLRTVAVGSSRRKAEQEAAHKALQLLANE